MLNVLKANAGALELTAESGHFDATLTRTIDQLETQTADISIASVAVENGRLDVVVRVENRAEHKLPSGIPLRRAWIYIKDNRLLPTGFDKGTAGGDIAVYGEAGVCRVSVVVIERVGVGHDVRGHAGRGSIDAAGQGVAARADAVHGCAVDPG